MDVSCSCCVAAVVAGTSLGVSCCVAAETSLDASCCVAAETSVAVACCCCCTAGVKSGVDVVGMERGSV